MVREQVSPTSSGLQDVAKFKSSKLTSSEGERCFLVLCCDSLGGIWISLSSMVILLKQCLDDFWTVGHILQFQLTNRFLLVIRIAMPSLHSVWRLDVRGMTERQLSLHLNSRKALFGWDAREQNAGISEAPISVHNLIDTALMMLSIPL